MERRRTSLCLLAAALGCLVALAAIPGPASAATVVGPGQSLERALADAPPGGTVLVRGGRYPRLTLADGQRLRGVTLRPYRRARPRLHGVEIGLRAGGLRIEGFRITDITELDDVRSVSFVDSEFTPHGLTGSGRRLRFVGNDFHDLTIHRDRSAPGPRCHGFTESAGIAPRCGFAFRIYRSSDVVVRGNRMRRIPADGLQLLEVRDFTIEDNLFEGIEPFVDPAEHSDAIQILGDSDRVTIRRNVFRDARGILAQPFKGEGAHRRMVIESNSFTRLWHWGVNLYDAPGARIVSNTIWDTGGRGIGLSDHGGDPTPMTGAVVLNNVVSILLAEPETMAVEDYNLVGEGTATGAHDVRVRRPGFVDPGQGDYRLAAGSPAIDAGLASAAPGRDITGAPRLDLPGIGPPWGSAADIGAHEHGSGPPRR